jgi:hypothetical protein
VWRAPYGRGRWHIIPSAFPPDVLRALADLADLAPNGDRRSAADADEVNGHNLRLLARRW